MYEHEALFVNRCSTPRRSLICKTNSHKKTKQKQQQDFDLKDRVGVRVSYNHNGIKYEGT